MAASAIRISILANARDAIRQVNATARAVRGLDRESKAGGGLGRLSGDADRATRSLNKVDGRLGKVSRSFGTVGRNAGRMSAAVGKSLTKISGSTAKVGGKTIGYSLMGFIAVGILSGAGQVASALSAGLIASLPAAGVLPGFAVAAASAFTVLKVAVAGVGDALKSGFAAAASGSAADLKKFEESLKDLAPAAADTVREIVALKPALDGARKAISGAFFVGLAEQVKTLAGTYLPLLTQHGKEVAGSFNLAAVETANFAKQSSTVSSVKGILDNVSTAIGNITAGLPDIVRGFLPLFSVSASLLPGLTKGFGGVAERFATFMEQAEKSGALKAFIEGGLDALKQLFGILGSVGGILKSVFVDGNTGAGTFFTTIASVLEQVDKFLNTAGGMAAISAVWDVLGQVGSALGDALAVVLPALGDAITALAPAIGPLVTALSDFLIALSPILPVIGEVAAVIAGELAKALPILAPALVILATAFGEMLKALAPIIPVIAQVAAVLAGELAKALPILTPALIIVAETIGKVLTAAAPLLPVIAELAAVLATALAGAITDLLPALEPFIAALAGGLLDAVTALAPLLPVLAQVFGALLTAATPLIDPLVQIVAALAGGLVDIVPILLPLITDLVAALGPALGGVLTAIAGIVPQLVGALTKLLPVFAAIVTTIIPLLPLLLGIATTIIEKLTPFIQPLIIAIVAIVAAMKVWAIIQAVLNAVMLLNPITLIVLAIIALIAIIVVIATKTKFFQTVWAAVWGAIKTAAVAVFDFLKNYFVAVIETYKQIFQKCIGAFKAVWSGILSVVDTVKEFAGTVKGLFEDFVSFMADLPDRIITGFIDGLKAGWGKVTDFFKGAIDLIPDGIKGALGIGSPSKVMDGFGQNIGQGLVRGIRKQVPAIKKTMTALSTVVTKGVDTDATVRLRADATIDRTAIGGSVGAAAVTPVTINVSVANGADAAEVGRKAVAAIEAWQKRSGRKHLVTA